MTSGPEQMLTTDDVARWMRVKRETVQEYARSGRLQSVKPGRSRLFRREWVEEFMAQESTSIRRRSKATNRLRDAM